MNQKTLTFEQAAEAFLSVAEGFDRIPEQPNRELSKLQGTTWHLRNIRGPLARVNRHGEVWVKMLEAVNC